MRLAISCSLMLLACGHPSAPSVTVNVSCSGSARVVAIASDQRVDDHLCGEAWTALRIEHGPRTELVHAVAGREVWLRRVDRRAVIELRAGSAVTATFDGVTEIAEGTAPAHAASIEIDANGVVTEVALADLRARFEQGGSGGRDVSLCAVAAAYVPAAHRIEVTGDKNAKDAPVVVTPEECATRGLVLRFSSQGELRLRTGAGDHVIQQVIRISARL